MRTGAQELIDGNTLLGTSSAANSIVKTTYFIKLLYGSKQFDAHDSTQASLRVTTVIQRLKFTSSTVE